MRALKQVDNPELILELFNKTQCKSVLATIQEDPYFDDQNHLILKIGLSLESIKKHLQKINVSIGSKSLYMSKKGVAKLNKVATAANEGIDRYEAIVKFHKLVDLPTFLNIIGLSIGQLVALLNHMIHFGNHPQQTMAKSILLTIPNDILDQHKEYSDELTENIRLTLVR